MTKYITLSQLTKTTKGLVNKINSEIIVENNKIGTLSNLTTTAKTDLVAAINEVASSSGGITTETDPTVPAWAKSESKPTYTFSELTSHPTTLNDYGITDAYTKTEVNGLVSGVLHYKGTKATVSELPSSENTTGDVWHITADGSEQAWDGSTWQELGTAIDLSGYLQTGDIASWAKAANKPTYTASEVGALPDTTTIPTKVSDLTNDSGFLTSYTETDPIFSASAAAGISLTDISNWNAKSDFSGSYNDLSNKPTIPAAQVQSDWNATTGMGVILNKPTIPSATTVIQVLTSGTLIATINGTNIYAPAYTNADGVSY